mmetsp:Transcript_126794/g.253527  ORF Transcript_126794/g.253527 Transcript_126794/m.253527 type:complete len:224 (+) Transcript_126794:34-705(+)
MDTDEVAPLSVELGDAEISSKYNRTRTVVLGAGLLLAFCAAALQMGGVGDVLSAGGDVPTAGSLTSRRRRGKAAHGSGLDLVGLTLVKKHEGLGEDLGDEMGCLSNKACSSKRSGTFCHENACAPCSECEHCWDGINGQCECGEGYPTKGSTECEHNATISTQQGRECLKHLECKHCKTRPFCYDGTCDRCKECEYCLDGIDGTCGSCGNGYLIEDSACPETV